MISGAVGGVVSWIYSMTIGTAFPIPASLAALACCVLGSASALISVYIVANSDLTNTARLIAFALLAGFSGSQQISLNSVRDPKSTAIALNQIRVTAMQTGNPDLALEAAAKLRTQAKGTPFSPMSIQTTATAFHDLRATPNTLTGFEKIRPSVDKNH